MNLRDLWPFDGSPGYSDYPRNDIRSHRSLAQFGRWMALIMFFGGLWFASRTGMSIAIPIALTAVLYTTALGLQFQALRWEVQLTNEVSDKE